VLVLALGPETHFAPWPSPGNHGAAGEIVSGLLRAGEGGAQRLAGRAMSRAALTGLLNERPRARLAVLPTPIHPLARLSRQLGGPELWIKRDDLTGLAGGGNKTRKLEFLVGDALAKAADTLVTVGAIQSNHTRQTAAAAARVGLRCVLLHNGWASDAGADYRRVGNILYSDLLGAELYVDDTERRVGESGRLADLCRRLREEGRRPYDFPCGGSEHPLGGLGYFACALEIEAQMQELGLGLDYVVHTTGSSSTQAGLLAGFAAVGSQTRVIGVSDDEEREIKVPRVLQLANDTLRELGIATEASFPDVEIVIADPAPYGDASPALVEAIRILARAEGLLADPVYEGRAIRGLIDLVADGRFERADRVLLLHLGGCPAVHGYADQLRQRELVSL
jgi:1-aminocyclopropane-1-carboxylate deaminase